MAVFSESGPLNIYHVSRAPELPGIYVWYAKLPLGKADWQSDSAGGCDTASKRLKGLIQKHSLNHSSQGVDVTIKARFSNHWCGSLSEDEKARWGEGLTKGLDAICSHENTRSALVDLLQICFPKYCGPLYIGITSGQTLRKRLLQHSKAYRDLYDRKHEANEPVDPDTFARRAFNAGFTPSELFCYVISIDSEVEGKLTDEELRQLLESAEWLLNRWSMPPLGKR